MSLAALHSSLKTLLTANAGLVTWAADTFGAQWSVFDGLPLERLEEIDCPAIVFHLGEGSANVDIETLDGRRCSVAVSHILLLAWHEEDSAAAFAERLELPDLVTAALLSDPTLGGVVDWLHVAAWSEEAEVEHPRHALRVQIDAHYQISV